MASFLKGKAKHSVFKEILDCDPHITVQVWSLLFIIDILPSKLDMVVLSDDSHEMIVLSNGFVVLEQYGEEPKEFLHVKGGIIIMVALIENLLDLVFIRSRILFFVKGAPEDLDRGSKCFKWDNIKGVSSVWIGDDSKGYHANGFMESELSDLDKLYPIQSAVKLVDLGDIPEPFGIFGIDLFIFHDSLKFCLINFAWVVFVNMLENSHEEVFKYIVVEVSSDYLGNFGSRILFRGISLCIISTFCIICWSCINKGVVDTIVQVTNSLRL